MRFGNKLIVGLMLTVLSLGVSASNLRDLMIEAIVNGKSEGQLDPELVEVFSTQTKSKQPITIRVTRATRYDNECAELEIVTSQAGVKDNNGKVGVFDLAFKLPLCINGKYPPMLESQDKIRHAEMMEKCKFSIKKYGESSKDKMIEGAIEFNSCPKGGVVGIYYDGTCKDLGPSGDNAQVKEFKINSKGDLNIQMKIPKSCLKKDKPEKNMWQLFIFERRAPTYPKELAGRTKIEWN